MSVEGGDPSDSTGAKSGCCSPARRRQGLRTTVHSSNDAPREAAPREGPSREAAGGLSLADITNGARRSPGTAPPLSADAACGRSPGPPNGSRLAERDELGAESLSQRPTSDGGVKHGADVNPGVLGAQADRTGYVSAGPTPMLSRRQLLPESAHLQQDGELPSNMSGGRGPDMADHVTDDDRPSSNGPAPDQPLSNTFDLDPSVGQAPDRSGRDKCAEGLGRSGEHGPGGGDTDEAQSKPCTAECGSRSQHKSGNISETCPEAGSARVSYEGPILTWNRRGTAASPGRACPGPGPWEAPVFPSRQAVSAGLLADFQSQPSRPARLHAPEWDALPCASWGGTLSSQRQSLTKSATWNRAELPTSCAGECVHSVKMGPPRPPLLSPG